MIKNRIIVFYKIILKHTLLSKMRKKLFRKIKMEISLKRVKETETLAENCLKLVKAIYNHLLIRINGKRKIMYSDIIRYIVKENYRGPNYDAIIVWCNSKIKKGILFFEK
ncbi:MAG: hypothetical protein ACTSW3_07365 [Promethearchaeota archaeon]